MGRELAIIRPSSDVGRVRVQRDVTKVRNHLHFSFPVIVTRLQSILRRFLDLGTLIRRLDELVQEFRGR